MRQYHLPHLHRPDWHQLGMEVDRMVHASWFWPTIALLFFILLMTIAVLFGKGDTNQLPYYPMRYPMMP